MKGNNVKIKLWKVFCLFDLFLPQAISNAWPTNLKLIEPKKGTRRREKCKKKQLKLNPTEMSGYKICNDCAQMAWKKIKNEQKAQPNLDWINKIILKTMRIAVALPHRRLTCVPLLLLCASSNRRYYVVFARLTENLIRIVRYDCSEQKQLKTAETMEILVFITL